MKKKIKNILRKASNILLILSFIIFVISLYIGIFLMGLALNNYYILLLILKELIQK